MNGRRKVEKWDRAQHELSNDFLLKKDSSEIETLEEVNIDVISDGATDLSQIFVVEDTRQRLIVATNISSLNDFFLYIRITVLILQLHCNVCMFGKLCRKWAVKLIWKLCNRNLVFKSQTYLAFTFLFGLSWVEMKDIPTSFRIVLIDTLLCTMTGKKVHTKHNFSRYPHTIQLNMFWSFFIPSPT